MIDYKPTLVSELKKLGLPVHYELFLSQNTQLPCISYQEGNNSSYREGDTLRYSEITFRIKVWAKEIKTIAAYSQQIDDLMLSLGFRRINTNELWVNGIGQNLMTYRGKGLEQITEE
jgi:hypothetical protein